MFVPKLSLFFTPVRFMKTTDEKGKFAITNMKVGQTAAECDRLIGNRSRGTCTKIFPLSERYLLRFGEKKC